MILKRGKPKRIIIILSFLFIGYFFLQGGSWLLEEYFFKPECKILNNYDPEVSKSKVEEVYNLILPKIQASEVYSEYIPPHCAYMGISSIAMGGSANKIYKSHLISANLISELDKIMMQLKWESRNPTDEPIYCKRIEEERLCLSISYGSNETRKSIKDNSVLDLKGKEKENGLTISVRVTHWIEYPYN